MRNNLERLIVLLLLLLSGSIYFDYRILNYILEGVTLIFVIICTFKKIRLIKYNLIMFLALSTLLFFQTYITLGYGVNLKDFYKLIIIMLLLMIISSNMSKISFINKYINIITIICIISLICSFLINIVSVGNLPFEKLVLSSNGLVSRLATPYFTIRIQHADGTIIDQQRNSGLFWEPGAFQSFINLAILFLISSIKKVRKIDAFKLLIFVITIITTQSTTGYVVLALALIFTAIRLRKLKYGAKYFTRLVFLLIVAGIAINYQYLYQIISYKLIDRNASYTTRLTIDTSGGFQLFTHNPWLGYGYSSERLNALFNSIGSTANSNGIVILLCEFGLIVSGVYFAFLIRGIKSFFDVKRISLLILLTIFAIIFSTEDLVLKPLFLVILFSWSQAEECDQHFILK